MKSALAQNSLWLCRTAKPSSEGYESKGTEHETTCWLRHLSEPDTLALVRSGMWEVIPLRDYGVAMWFVPLSLVLITHCLYSSKAQVLLLPSVNEQSFQQHLLFLSSFLYLVSLVSHGSAETPETTVFELLVRKSGELLNWREEWWKERLIIWEKGDRHPNNFWFNLRKKKSGLLEKGLNTTQNCCKILCPVSHANSGHYSFHHL